MRQILRDLPPERDKRLVSLSRQFPPSSRSRAGEKFSPLDKLRLMVVHLAQNWAKFRVFDRQEGVPWTNYPAEQVIGKMCTRTVRSYKNRLGMAGGLMLAGVGMA